MSLSWAPAWEAPPFARLSQRGRACASSASSAAAGSIPPPCRRSTTRWQRAAVGSWAASPDLRLQAGGNPFSADYAIDDSASDLKPLMWSGVGGSTITWAAHFPRLHPSDFRTRSLDGVGEDWPFGYDALEPYYDLNDRMMGVSGLAGDPAYPPKPARPSRRWPSAGSAWWRPAASIALGWHWWPVDAAINSRGHDGRPGCNRCGPCLIGCVSRAKASTDVTYWPRAIAAGVELRHRAIVQQVVIEAGRATALLYREPTAATSAAGGPCRHRRQWHRDGAASARLGRGEPGLGPPSHVSPGAPMPAACSPSRWTGRRARRLRDLFPRILRDRRRRGFKRGVHLQVTRENALFSSGPAAGAALGRRRCDRRREEFHHSIAVLVTVEDLPEAENRVTLDRRVESDGLPGVKAEYPCRSIAAHARFRPRPGGGDAARRRCRRDRAVAARAHDRLASARDGAHGRRSGDHRHRCKRPLHAVADLMIADGSLFPAVGAVNPGSTIGALALKFADDLARGASA